MFPGNVKIDVPGEFSGNREGMFKDCQSDINITIFKLNQLNANIVLIELFFLTKTYLLNTLTFFY